MEKPFSKKGEEALMRNCMYLGGFKKRIVCDSVGDDVSQEFCLYCQYLSKTYNLKPRRVASSLYRKIDIILKEAKGTRN